MLTVWHESMHNSLRTYTAHKSRYKHKDEPHERPLMYTHVGRINQIDRRSSIIYKVPAESFRA